MRLSNRPTGSSARPWRRLLIGVSAAAAALTPMVPAALRASAAPPAAATVAWSPCYQWLAVEQSADSPVRYECAQVPVPLDHDRPNGASIQIAMVRIPASDPQNRIGSLFLNPGGPGGSGIDFTIFAGPFLYTDEVRARFDIVGFDPRGIGRSTQLRCAGSNRQIGAWFTAVVWPETTEEIADWAAADAAMQSDCDQKGGRILDHMSTADVARDLDLLRAAVGDEQLSYAGYSYGSFLGTTYANLFPSRVRAVVVDGVLDPIDWTTGDPGQEDEPFSTRLRSDIGARDTLNEFFRLCDEAADTCAFSAPGGTAARYDALESLLRAEPIDFDGFLYDHRVLIGDSLGALYDSPSWSSFAEYLAFIESQASGAEPVTATTFQSKRRSVGSGRGGFPVYFGVEAFAGVACGDSDNPDSLAAWAAAAGEREQESRFGPLWTWISSICSAWPGAGDDRYTGPFTADTANPVLVASTRFDPATPLHGADRVADLLPNSRQLIVEGWGHTTLFLSAAADEAVSAYLLDGTLPPEGAVFEQDVDPMAGPAEGQASAAFRAKYLAALLGERSAR